MAQYDNPGASLLSGISAGQGIRAGYEEHKGHQATKKFFEKLRQLEQPEDAGIPTSDTAGSEGPAATVGAAIGVIPLDGGAIQPTTKKKYRSFTSDDMSELNALAASAATAGGDPKVYDALRGTARSYMQTKVLDQFRKANVAYQVGDDEGLEDALHSAYQYMPDGKELKLKRDKDGKLQFRHPQSGEYLPVNAESIGFFARAAMDPVAFDETLYGRKKDKVEQGQKDRALNTDAQNAETAANNADSAREGRLETERHNKAEEKQKAGDSKSENLLRNAQALYYMNYAGYLGRDKGKDGKGGDDMDNQRKFAGDVRKVAESYIMPTELTVVDDELGGQKTLNAPAKRLPGFENANADTVNTVSSYAEQIGIANPQLGLSQAVGAGATIYKALQGQGNLHIDPKSNLLGIEVGGRMQTFRVPPELMMTLQQRAQKASPVQ